METVSMIVDNRRTAIALNYCELPIGFCLYPAGSVSLLLSVNNGKSNVNFSSIEL